jgi:hypothetical protein
VLGHFVEQFDAAVHIGANDPFADAAENHEKAITLGGWRRLRSPAQNARIVFGSIG